MKRIKTREKVKDVKVLDKSKVVGERMKSAFIQSKGHTKNLTDDGQVTPNEYAEDQVQYAAEDISRDAAHAAGSGVKAAGRKGKEVLHRCRAKATAKTAQRTVKTAHQTAKGAVKTAERTSKAAIKTAEHTARVTPMAAQATANAAKITVQTARAAAKATAATAKATAKAIAAAVKATVAEVKALITAIAAGGWVAILVIVIICMIGLLVGSCFGIFFSGENTGTGQTLQTAVQEINQGYEDKLEEIKADAPHDVLEMSGSRAVWPDVLAVYAVKTATDPNHPQEVATMDNGKKALLKEIFWAMNEVSRYTGTVTTTWTVETVDADGNVIVSEVEVITTTLYITVSHRTADEMADQYGFTLAQRGQLAELLADENSGMWSSTLSGIGLGGG